MKELIVLKLGTSVLTDEHGRLNEAAMKLLVRQIAELSKSFRLAVVSSGSVAAGQSKISGFSGKESERKAAAAIGSPRLIAKYTEYLSEYEIAAAQILCDRDVFSVRKRYLELQNTLTTLWRHGVVPIINENDALSSFELRFSDNDELATLFAVAFNAQKLLIGSSVDGLMDDDKLVKQITKFDDRVFSLVKTHKSTFGLGGMLSKLTCAERATKFGVEVVIFNALKPTGVTKAAAGQSGTLCKARKSSLSSYHKWVAGIGLVLASIKVDPGAKQALGRRKSLLAVGIKAVDGSFKAGEIVEIRQEATNEMIAVARTSVDSQQLAAAEDRHGLVVAHANEVVLW